MSFKKLALVSAMFAATSGAFAMEALDEEAMAATTGQDGITVTITLANPISMNQIIHDKDGWAGAGTPQGGAIVIGDVGTSTTPNGGMSIALGGALTLDIDADGGNAGGTAPYLNIGVSLTGATTISTGDLRVASSATSAAGGGIGTIDDTAATTYSSVIMNSMDIVLGATNLNIQLGNEPQGHMIVVDTVMTGGLTINNMSLNDANSGGSISMVSQHLYDAGGTDLSVAANIDVTGSGLAIELAQFGDVANGASVDITGVKLGGVAAAEIGDIEIRGLNLNGTTITIAGH